jgi:GH35 family endo-1,4-beta-xylanase
MKAHGKTGKPLQSRRELLRMLGGLAATTLVPIPGVVGAAAGRERSPSTGYRGMEDGAAWRREAKARVERLRKADFSVAVTDGSGAPVPGATLEVQLYRHHFGFGAAVQPKHLIELGDRRRREFYRGITRRCFHRATISNGLKWKHHAAQKHNVEQFLAWCVEHQLPVRGHCLVWPRFRRIPDELHHLANDRPALRRAIEDHVTGFVSMFDEPLIEWDVLNEPFSEHEFMDLLGPEAVHDWFRLAREANPRLVRYINDYGVLTRPSPEHQDFYYDYIQGLLDTGVPVQGIGFQGHIPERYEPTPPEELLATMDRFATLGLPLQVTEFDFETRDLELQARYTEDFLWAVFGHPAMTGLVTWTPFEYERGQGPKPDAAMWDHRLHEKPNGQAWNALVNGIWRTRLRLTTDAQGLATFRGFKGTYRIAATAGAVDASLQTRLVAGGDRADLVLG